MEHNYVGKFLDICGIDKEKNFAKNPKFKENISGLFKRDMALYAKGKTKGSLFSKKIESDLYCKEALYESEKDAIILTLIYDFDILQRTKYIGGYYEQRIEMSSIGIKIIEEKYNIDGNNLEDKMLSFTKQPQISGIEKAEDSWINLLHNTLKKNNEKDASEFVDYHIDGVITANNKK